MFELFDPAEEFTIRERKLPHWFQPGVTYFVTFRTADSVPQALMRSWHIRRDDWLRRHGFDPGGDSWKLRLRETPELDREYHKRFTREFMAYLDRSYGACPLRDKRLSEIVAKSLQHFDGERYRLGDLVVMPNHVHVLACLLGGTEIEKQCRSWKRFTSKQINRVLGRNGRFWQAENFDYLVRSVAQFEYFQRYVAENPVKARLLRGDYLLHSTLAGRCGQSSGTASRSVS